MLRRFMAVGTILLAFALGNAYAEDAATSNVNRDTTPAYGTTTNRTDNGFNTGWLGLIGLAGLAGLMPRNRDNRTDAGRTTAR